MVGKNGSSPHLMAVLPRPISSSDPVTNYTTNPTIPSNETSTLLCNSVSSRYCSPYDKPSSEEITLMNFVVDLRLPGMDISLAPLLQV